MEGFGKRVVLARENKGYSQKQLAELLDITPTRLNYWEKDKREPDFFMFTKIADTLDVDPNILLGLDVKQDIDSNEFTNLYEQLDIEDKAEIRGTMKQMLKDKKYALIVDKSKLNA